MGVRVKVLLVDDDQDLLDAMSDLIRDNPSFELVGAASTVDHAMAIAARNPPELAVVDVSMPGAGGRWLAAALRELCPSTRILVYSVHDDPETVQAMTRVGAQGYIAKGRRGLDLAEALLGVARGESVFHVPSGLMTDLVTASDELAVQAAAQQRLAVDLSSLEIQFQALWDESPLGRLLASSDLQPFRVNRALCDLLGYDEAELLRTSLLGLTHAQDRETLATAMQQVLGAAAAPRVRAQIRLSTRSGSVVWADIHIRSVRSTDGRLRFLQVSVNDITDLRQAEQREADLHVAVEEILRSSSDRRHVGKVAAGWAARLAGGTAAFLADGRELIGLENIGAAAAQDLLRARIESGEVIARPPVERAGRVVWIALRLSGRSGWLGIITSSDGTLSMPVAKSLERLAEAAGNGIDRAMTIERLTALEEVKSSFLNLASHELRGPLTTLLGYLSMLSGGAFGQLDEGVRNVIELLQTSGTHMHDLVDRMLATAMLEEGQTVQVLRAVDLADVVREVVQERASESQAGEHPTALRFGRRRAVAKADMDSVRTILRNLVDNAAKFSPPASRIECSVAVKDGWAKVAVRDHGAGIEDQDLATLFTRFGRIESPQTRHVGGIGLGLYLSRELARAQGGDLTVTSRPGRGSVFTLQLPLHEPVTGAAVAHE